MKEYKKYILYALSILFFVLAAIQENQTLNNHPEIKLIQNFNKTLISQEYKLSTYLNSAEKRLTELASENYASTFSDLSHLFGSDALGFLIFRDQKMVYWSDNQFAFPNLPEKISDTNRVLNLPNGIFVTQKRIVGKYELIGLVLVKNNYSYENQYLKNRFVPPFKLPANFRISLSKINNTFEINDIENKFLFSVIPGGQKTFNESQLYFPIFLYFLGFVFLLLSLYQRIGYYKEEGFGIKMFLLLIVLFIIYWIHIIFGIPAIINRFPLFSAQYYAVSTWLPSLGDFFIVTTLFFFWSVVFVKEFPPEERLAKQFIIPAFASVGMLYELVSYLIENLIKNSNITYKLNRITDIDQYSVSGYLAIALLLFSVFLIHLKIIERTEYLNRNSRFLKLNLPALLLSVVLCVIFPAGWSYILTLFFAVNVLQCQIKRMHISPNSLSYSILFISLFSVVSVLLVYNTVNKRDIQVQKLLAINLSSEQDATAEVYLARMQNQFNTDSIIPSLLIPPYNELENYLMRTYFSGYFRKYDIQVIACAGNDSVYIQSEDVSEPCFPYFEKMIKNSGTNIPGSKFHFMNNMNGRVSYFGELHYQRADIPSGISVFIEIDSKIFSEGIGFPELLMDRSIIRPFRYKYLSYAKYFDEELVNMSGEYTYNKYLQSYIPRDTNSEFELLKWDGYDHLVYNFDEKNCIIVSNKSLKFADYLISFPYIFVFYFVFALLISLAGNSNFRKLIIPRDLRFRIQVSIISIVLISLLFVATGTIYYNIQEYRDRHQVDLQEKIKSISEEIKSRLIYENRIDPELQQWLYTELYKLSNIFRTDINIYDVNGEMIATSRPEIFAKGIISERMNSKAFYELSERYQLNYFQPEKIGDLSYLSAYEPILNNAGDYLGYLNLPYFTREDELKQGISTFIVAFINLYLILFLASVIVAVFLSNRITQPLSLIREKLRGIQLGKKNEQINYQAEDEIGALVKEYNHKVDELVEGAELLARSERESAWREMAKQIAHEIKNPLTPMKLNIQYLQRAKIEGKEHYDDFFDRVTKNLIEQIDTLSGIATEFSNFAQIPKAKNEVFNLIDVLKNLSSLFEPNQNLHFTLDIGKLHEVLVFADKEQVSRAFLNLIKNAIQAIPADQKGEIRIRVLKLSSVVQITITDNGAGISPEAQQRLFEPNFTTKTSGMGLGLSIVRDIITTINGKIWYETSASNGTSFYVEIPRYEASPKTENNHT
ncbi:MAG: ATP-binding protein [Prolixibacteraceae bacterium]|jgi:signal transduction histidine kinase